MPKRTSLPSMLPPDCVSAGALVDSVQQGIAVRLRPVSGRHSGDEQNRHGRPHRPAVAGRSGHAAQRVGESGWDGEDRKHLQEVGERRGVLEGMGAVGVEKSAAVGAQHLDGFLRGDRALRDGLVVTVSITGLPSGPTTGFRRCPHLHLSAARPASPCRRASGSARRPAKPAPAHRRCRIGSSTQSVAAGHVHPEVADGFFLAARDAANERDGQRDAHRRRSEVVIGQAGHLGEIAHGGFAAHSSASWCWW